MTKSFRFSCFLSLSLYLQLCLPSLPLKLDFLLPCQLVRVLAAVLPADFIASCPSARLSCWALASPHVCLSLPHLGDVSVMPMILACQLAGQSQSPWCGTPARSVPPVTAHRRGSVWICNGDPSFQCPPILKADCYCSPSRPPGRAPSPFCR